MKKRRGLADRGYSRKARNQALPILERVEDRVLMAAFVVTSVTDSSAATANDGTLRGEILGSNATTSANTLTFNLPPGQPTITLGGPLPVISTQLTIQGPTGTGPGGGTVPLVQINETINSAVGPAFTVNVANSQIRNLIIDNIQGDAIDLLGASDQVAGCYIGVDPTGAILQANLGVGIFIDSASNTIGDPTTNPNVITGNTTAIEVFGGAGKNTIVHNYIGTNAAGTATLTNLASLDNGIDLETANNTIGGIAANGPLGQGNLISGVSNPLLIAGGANKNLVQGNYIGTDVTGLLPLGNFTAGIDINAVNTNTIGGTAAGAANVIGANKLYGVEIQGPSAQFNQIRGNLIGVGVDKTTPLGNTLDGVFINGSSNNVVGGTIIQGTAPAFGNVIDFNGSSVAGSGGVYLNGGVGNGILSNSIYLNGGPGIVLSGANGGVQPPRLISAQSGAAETRISGTYAGNPKTAYRIQFFASQNANPSGSGDGQTFLGDLDILTDSVGNYTFNQVLMKGAPVGSFISATATQNVITLNNSSAFANDVEATQAAVTDLSVTTAVPTTAPLLNQPYIYTLTVTNNGPNDSTGVILSDTIPTNSIYLGSSAGSYGGGVVTDNIGTLASGASVMVTITVNPTKVGTFLNTATVTGDELDTNLGNNTSVTTSTVAADADLGVTLTPSITNAPIGSQVGYVLTVSNNGPSTATGTSVTVQFPSSFSNFIAMPDQGSYVINPDNSITISLGVIPSGSASTTQLTATPTAVGPATTTATVMSPLLDPDTANNVATATINVANAADLGVAISADPNPVLIGGELIYTVVVTNNGPSVATSPLVLDPLPAGLTFDPTNSNAGPGGTISIAGGVVSASIPSLASNATQTILIAVLPTVSGQVTNTVTVGDPNNTTPQEIDPDLTNNIASTVVQVSPADLSVVVNNPNDPLLIGSHAVYQLTVTNNGPADAHNVMLSDLFSGPATIVATSLGNPTGDALNVNLGTIAANQTINVSIIINPTASGTVVDSASVSADEVDPDPNNNTSSSSNVVSPADVSVVVTASTPSTLTGQAVTFIAVVTNNGPATATNVQFTNLLPAGTTLLAQAATQGGLILSGGTTLSGNLGSLASGASATVYIVVNPVAIGTDTDTATALADNLDPNPNNNSGSATISATNTPGIIQFQQATQFVAENAHYISLTVDRVGGSLGTVLVSYRTRDFTAVNGVNYVGGTGTIGFLDGQTTSTINIAVLDDHVVNGANAFFVDFTGATGGVTFGNPVTEGVVVLNTDRDMVPPVVTSLIAIPNGTSIGGFLISFDKPMDPTRAGYLPNYHLFLTNAGNSQTPLSLAAAIYNPGNNSVTLVPGAPLPSNRFYRLVVNGSTGFPLEDTVGNVLAGSSGPNSNYDVFYGQGTQLVYDSQNNVVTINLTGGGIMSIFRSANGDAQTINLYGIVPHQSKLSGSVVKLNKFGSGHTNIGTINGFGQFGNVKSTLTTPSFYVGSAPVSASSVHSESLVTTSAITSKKATPKGPKLARR